MYDVETKSVLNSRQVSFGNSYMLHCIIILGILNSNTAIMIVYCVKTSIETLKSIDYSAMSDFLSLIGWDKVLLGKSLNDMINILYCCRYFCSLKKYSSRFKLFFTIPKSFYFESRTRLIEEEMFIDHFSPESATQFDT